MADKAERDNRGARAKTRILFLVGALLPILLSGLMFARAAQAATTAPAIPAASAAAAGHAAPSSPAAPAAPAAGAVKSATAAPAASGPCAIPGVGDLASLAGLCGAGSGLGGDLNNICSPGTQVPEQATSGLDAMIEPPGGTPSPSQLAAGKGTLYDQYGIAGENWAAYNLQCSDMTSLIGNQIANLAFGFAKSLDRLTITVYQSAAGSNVLSWLSGSVDTLISNLGNAIYFPYLAPVVILGAIWLAWQGLIRKRATRTIEGTIWMVIACAAAIWLIGQPQDFTSIGSDVSNGVTGVMNTAFAKLPPPQDKDCLPVGGNDPQSVSQNFSFSSGNDLVDQNANELWSVLVCKPWLAGEFGTTVYTGSANPAQQTIVDQYGRQLLWSQAIAMDETSSPALITQKQDVYQGIAQQIQTKYPADYTLFQGNQWTTRLEIGFSALFAAVAAGLLVLLIALTLILLKLGFLLLLVAGPFFLIVGTHPGFGRVVAIRWFEMLVGVLLKQIAVALTLSVLLYCYSLIMGTSDTALPWVLKIIMIALVTVAVFIYRKPFQHLFSAVGYGMIGSSAAEGSFREATSGFRRVTVTATGAAAGAAGGAAGAMVPGVGLRGARWARRFSESAAPAAGGEAGAAAGGMAGAASAAASGVRSSAGGESSAGRLSPGRGPTGGSGGSGGSVGAGGPGGSGGSAPAAGRGRQWPETGYGSGSRAAPPLPPSRPGSGGGSGAGGGAGSASAGWARSSGSRASTGPMPRATGAPGGGSASSGSSAPTPAAPPTASPWTRPFRRGK